MEDVVARVQKGARLNDVAAIGPVFWQPKPDDCGYLESQPDDWVWYVVVGAGSRRKPQFNIDCIILGLVVDDPPDLPCRRGARMLPGVNYITRDEANDLRLQLADKLRQQFAGVKLFDSELEQAKFCASNWPSAVGDSIVEEITRAQKDARSRAGAGTAGYHTYLSDDELSRHKREKRGVTGESIPRLTDQVEDTWNHVVPAILNADGDYDREHALRSRVHEQLDEDCDLLTCRWPPQIHSCGTRLPFGFSRTKKRGEVRR